MKTRTLIEMVLNSDFTHVCVRVCVLTRLSQNWICRKIRKNNLKRRKIKMKEAVNLKNAYILLRKTQFLFI